MRRAEYERLVALGAFEDERVELLHGVLVDMSPNKPGHVSPIDRLTMILVPALVGRAIVRVQSPIAAGDESEPEPDLAVVPPGDYRQEHPAHALLVIEVALSSLNKDRHVKAPLYAASGFLEYWIVDVAGQAVEVHAAPADGVYTPSSLAALIEARLAAADTVLAATVQLNKAVQAHEALDAHVPCDPRGGAGVAASHGAAVGQGASREAGDRTEEAG